MRLLTHNFLQSNVRGYVIEWEGFLHRLLCFPSFQSRIDHRRRWSTAFLSLTNIDYIAQWFSTTIATSRTSEGYPLKIQATKLVVESSIMDSVLVTKMLQKVNYPALLAAIEDVRSTPDIDAETSTTLIKATSIPSEAPGDDAFDESTLNALHFFLFDVHVLEGVLQCPDTNRKFPIKDGIPNMILHEDEVWWQVYTLITYTVY